MAQGINIVTLDGGLGVAPPDTGNRIFVVGSSRASVFDAGVAEPITSSVAADFRAAGGACKGTEASGMLVTKTGAAVTYIGFDAQTAVGTTYFKTLASGAVAGTQLTVALSAPVHDDLSIAVQFLNAGTFGVTGITYRITLDGGQTWSAVQQLGTALSISLAPYAQSLTFTAAEVVTATTQQNVVTFAPIGGTNAVAAVSKAISMRAAGDAILLASNESNATVASCIALVVAAESANRNFDLLTEGRDIDRTGAETFSAWGTAINTAFSHTVSRQWAPMAGHYPVTGGFVDSPVQRRSAAWLLASRYLLNEVHVDPARVSTGLSSVLTPYPTLPVPTGADRVMKEPGNTNDPDYLHDERVRPMFDANGIGSLGSLVDLDGFYSYNARLRSAPGSDFVYVQRSRLVHKARRIGYLALVKYMHDSLQLDPKTGFVIESTAAKIDAEVLGQMEAALIDSGNASAVSVRLSRNDDVLRTSAISMEGWIVPKGEVKAIRFTIGLTAVIS